ncbi:MAG: NTP transferase domain-containing protein [Dehalococcoidia bacterium]|nr:NTP transferase domain-containing protein [Dehalococcoidia bacterium]
MSGKLMKAIILAGGEATRLRPLTHNIPKTMVPVLNRPFLEHVIGYLKKHKIVDVILAMGQLSEQIQDYFGDGSEFGVRLTYSVENFPMGTAGAVKIAEKLLDESFIVLNGDIFTDLDLTAMINFHRERKAIATIALTPVENPTTYGVVETDGQSRVRRFMEKPPWDEITTNMINAGVYILEPDILGYVAFNTFFSFEHDVFPALLEKGEAVYGYPFESFWIDIGTPEKYFRLSRDLLLRYIGDKDVKFEGESFVHPSAQVVGPAIIGEGCFIDRDSVIKGPAVIGPGCQIGQGATVQGVVLWQNCKVGKEVKLRNCIIASNCYIEQRSEILDNCVLGDRVKVKEGSKLPKGALIQPNEVV